MSQDEMNNLFGSFEKMAKQMQDAVIETWSGATKQAVGSDGFSAASSAYLDWTLASQKQVRSSSAQFMDALEFPKRSDVARISKQISNAETRIADCEDALDKVLSVLQRLEAKVDAYVAQQADAPAKSASKAAPVAQAPVANSPVAEAPVAEAVVEEAPVVTESAPAKSGRKPKNTANVETAPDPAAEESKPKAGRAKKHSATVAKVSARAKKGK